MAKLLVLLHAPHEDLGSMGIFLEKKGYTLEKHFILHEKSTSLHLNNFHGLIVMGGPMSVHDTPLYPGLSLERDLITQAIAQKKPILGICLGAQLLAQTLGGEVTKNPVKEIGWYPLHLLPAAKEDPIFSSFKPDEKVFQWHGETFSLPPQALHLASSPLCVHQAFSYGRAYGLQFHVEVTPTLIKEWLHVDENKDELANLKGEIDPQQILKETPHHSSRLEELSQQLVDAIF